VIYRSIAQLQKKAGSVARVCEVLAVSRSGYYAAQRRGGREARVCPVSVRLQAAFARSGRCYGSRRLQAALRGEGIKLGRYRVRGLMRAHGLRATWKRKFIHTTDSRHSLPTAGNVLDRQFQPAGPNQAWVSDITYLRTRSGWLYLAAVMDLFSRKIVGWAMAPTMPAELVCSALQMAITQRSPSPGLIVHSDRGSQGVSIRYTERLAEAGIETSVGSKGDSYDNALAETINGLYKAELIHRRGPWKNAEAVELATLEWVAWFNHHRLLAPIGYMPPAEAEANYYRSQTGQAVLA